MSDDDLNRAFVQQQIKIKNYCPCPYTPYGSAIKNVVTDVDHFPYTRFYRGQYNDTKPHIWEREAGYHRLQNDMYKKTLTYQVHQPDVPFQIPCTTILRHKGSSCKSNLSNTYGCVTISP